MTEAILRGQKIIELYDSKSHSLRTEFAKNCGRFFAWIDGPASGLDGSGAGSRREAAEIRSKRFQAQKAH